MKSLYFILFFFYTSFFFAQKSEPPYIKSIVLRTSFKNSFTAIAPLGSTINLSFDDLEGDQKDYYYKIEQMTWDWKPSRLIPNQYIEGYDSNILLNLKNSFNTFQNYTHYEISFPNRNTRITKSGNYIVSILDVSENVIFSRKFVLYEDAAVVGVNVSRSRDAKTLNEKQNVRFTINHQDLPINNHSQEIHVVILQNENWHTAISDIQPQFFKPNQLIYNYTQKTNFWGGNEFLFFDAKIIQNTSLNIAKVERKEVFHNYLYPFDNPEVKTYSYNPDINGQFIIRTIEGADSNTEADYAFFHFRLNSEKIINKDVYVYGGFNNFKISNRTKMTYDKNTNSYRLKLLLKQGFYNYTYVTVDDKNNVSQAEIRGNFSQTENLYTVLVYYKPFGSLYDRVVAVSSVPFAGNQ